MTRIPPRPSRAERPRLKLGVLVCVFAVTVLGLDRARAQSQLVAWGDNSYGQCNVPAVPPGLTVVRVSAGYDHALAVLSDGTILAWGDNSAGQCVVPALAAGVQYVEADAGSEHSIARCSDGSVVTWGDNGSGQYDVPALPSGMTYIAVAAGAWHNIAIRSDGSAVAWGSNWIGQCNVPPLPSGVTYVSVAGGENNSIAVRSDGSAVAWGSNWFGQCDVPPLPSGVSYVEVAAGSPQCIARRNDGSVVGWGQNLYGQCNVPVLPPGLRYVQIAAAPGTELTTGPTSAAGHAVARRSDGSMVAWGDNIHGQCNVPPVPSGLTCVDVAAGWYFSVAGFAEADCNSNGIRDDHDIQAGTSVDCNGNGVPDECDLAHPVYADCDGNGLLDACEIAGNPSLDMNDDGRLDACPLDCEPRWQTNIGGHAGIDAPVNAMIVYDDGTGPALYVGGNFQSAGGVTASCVAKWDGASWSALGSGVSGGEVRAFAVYDEGSGPRLFVGGSFTAAGGLPLNWLARWDGTAWSSVGSGPSGELYALAVYDHGTGRALYTSGVQCWDGNSWLTLPPNPSGHDYPNAVRAMTVYDDGSGSALYFGGWYPPGDQLTKWDGSGFSTVFCGAGWQALSLATHDDGSGLSLFFGSYDSIGPTRWNGVSCSMLGGAMHVWPGCYSCVNIQSLVTFDDGSGPALYAGGNFNSAEGNQVNNIARWNGTSWSRLDTGVNGPVYCMCPFDDGMGTALYVGGDFTAVGHSPANRIARWRQSGGCVPTGTVICVPSTSSVIACPCANPPLGSGVGCNNSSGTGGARLTTTGFARIGNDNLVFTTSGERPTASSLVLQGSAAVQTGLVFGQGVRCVSGSLKRLYLKPAVGGSITAPGANDTRVSARSAALGSPIAPGMHRYYGVYYRDPIILGGCPASSGFNITQQLDVLWHP